MPERRRPRAERAVGPSGRGWAAHRVAGVLAQIRQHLDAGIAVELPVELRRCRFPERYEAGKPLFYRVHDAFHRNRAGEPLFPEDATAGAVYLLRNPLDVAVSWAFYSGVDFAASIAMLNDRRFWLRGQGCPQLRQRLFDWSSHVRSWTGAPFPVLAVRYEDLLADAAGQIGRVARFLRLEGASDAGRRRHAAASSGFDRLRQEEERAGFGERKAGNPHPFFRSGKAGGWRRHLNAAQVREVVRAHGETMAASGYDPQEALRETAAGGRGGGP